MGADVRENGNFVVVAETFIDLGSVRQQSTFTTCVPPSRRKDTRTGVDILVGEDIQTGRVQLSTVQSLQKRLLVNDAASRSVDKTRAILHLGKLLLAKALFRLRIQRHVQRDDIGLLQQFVEGLAVRSGEIGIGRFAVVVDDLHVESDGTASESLHIRASSSVVPGG